MNLTALSTQNWSALLKLRFRATEQKTHLIPERRYGPLSVQRAFYPEGRLCHTYLLHPPGGVVGGDELDLQVDVDAHAQTLLTTPGATKFYQSAEQTALVKQDFTLRPFSSLEFFPQENIYFPGAQVRSRTRVTLDKDCTAFIWEKHSYGRPVINEQFAQGEIISSIEVAMQKDLLFSETQRINWQEIQSASGLRGHPVAGTFLVYSNTLTPAVVAECRELDSHGGYSGLTRPLDELLVIRYMGSSTLELNEYFVSLWELLRPVILDRKSSHPRIWNT